MSLVILGVWAAVGLLLGLIMVAVMPWVVARILGTHAVEWVSSKYIWLAQTAISKSALIVRPGTIDLVAKRYDTDQKADRDTAGGEPRHHRDTLGGLRSLSNKPFGLTTHALDEYVTPLLAEIGSETKRRVEREEVGTPSGSQSRGPGAGSGAGGKMYDGIPIAAHSQIVDVRGGRHLTTGNADPEDGHRAYQKTVISQEKFHERVSFGQTIIIAGAFLASAGLVWLLASQSAPSTSQITGTLLATIVPGGLVSRARDAWQHYRESRWYDITAATLFVGGLVGVIPLIALLTHGLLAAVVVTLGMVAITVGYPVGIGLFGASLPVAIGQPLAKLNWTLAQLTVGRGVLVERDTGQFEHHRLHQHPDSHEHDWYCVLDSGDRLDIDGSKGDMVRFGWGSLAITAEKSQENMGSVTSNPPGGAVADGGELTSQAPRQGWQPTFSVETIEQSHWLVTLPQLWKWVAGSGESAAIREGRDTALTQQGGAQQISTLVFIGVLILVLALGGAFGLVAGGAI